MRKRYAEIKEAGDKIHSLLEVRLSLFIFKLFINLLGKTQFIHFCIDKSLRMLVCMH